MPVKVDNHIPSSDQNNELFPGDSGGPMVIDRRGPDGKCKLSLLIGKAVMKLLVHVKSNCESSPKN